MRIDLNFLLFLHMLDSRKNVYKKCDFESSGVMNIEVQTKKIQKNHGIQRIKTMEFHEKN